MDLPVFYTKEKIPMSGQDLISELPMNVTDEILRRLPLLTAAKMSVLSNRWRNNWLSLRNLAFDGCFWLLLWPSGNKYFDERRFSSIISSILFHHNGPIHNFNLYIPELDNIARLNLSQWLSFLSRNGVRNIKMRTVFHALAIPSHIFSCTELVTLKLANFIVNPPPSFFKGFLNLRSLELVNVEFGGDMIGSLIASCPQLEMLKLKHCTGMSHLVIDAPKVNFLSISGVFGSLGIKNVHSLVRCSLSLDIGSKNSLNAETVNAIKTLANSSELQYLHFVGILCKFLVAAGIMRSLPLAFNRVVRLSLTAVDLDDFDVFRCTFGMIWSCPFIKYLYILVIPSKIDVQHEFNCNDNYKLGHLLLVKIMEIRGSSAELKLIKHLLAISVVLEELHFQCCRLDCASELKMSRQLLQFPRASTKAQIVHSESGRF